MKKDILKEYVTLRSSLETERAKLVKRLKEIDAALGSFTAMAAEPVVKEAPVAKGKAKAKAKNRTMSEEGKARVAEAQRRRWAKMRASKGLPEKKAKPAKAKGKFSTAGIDAIREAQKRRWAKVRAEKAAQKKA